MTDDAPVPAFSGAQFQFLRGDAAPFWQGEGIFESGVAGHLEDAQVYFLPGLYHRPWVLPYLSSLTVPGACDFLPYRELGADWWLIVVAYAVTWLLAMLGWRRRKRRLERGFTSPPLA